MIDEAVKIAENRKVNGKYYKLVFESAKKLRVEPGQFMTVLVQPSLDPFLRRPFSYYRVSGRKVEVLYEVLGRGTKQLAEKQKGDVLKVMGPQGRAFKAKLAKKKKRVLVAGGVGVPPLVFLAEKTGTDYLLIGTKSKAEVLPSKELSKVKGKILYSTNDGSYGTQGYVTALLEPLILKEGAENLFVQTCGPNVMMQAVIDLARKHGIEGEASLDKPMACAIGACLGCMVKTKDGWTPSCTKGPVFSFDELDPEANICD